MMNSILDDPKATINHVNSLAFNRSTGSVGETEAAFYIRDQLDNKKIINNFEYFGYIGPKRVLMRLTYLIIITYLLLNKLLIVIVLYFSIKYLFATARNYSFIKEESSKNLVSTIPANNRRKKRPVVILTAHYDSFSTNLPYRLQNFLFFIFRIIIVPYFIIKLTISLWILANFIVSPNQESFIIDFILMSSIIEFLIYFLIFFLIYNTKKSMGAIDNASGVSIIIELAKKLNEKPLENMDVIIVFTSAEEWGLIGANRFCKRNQKSLSKKYNLNKSLNINYDMIGTYIGLLNKKSLFNRKEINQTLNKNLEDAANNLRISIVKHSPVISPKTDHKAFLKFAKKTKTDFQVACFHSAKDVKYIHSPRDTPDNCDVQNLNNVLEITIETLRKIDSESYPSEKIR
ncbi:MAG: M28 family peptidase [Candidatus Lokiarchaeota archaeon]|nr:M28 family peptidase [Candidatus Lokiarchaeota archaeon]